MIHAHSSLAALNVVLACASASSAQAQVTKDFQCIKRGVTARPPAIVPARPESGARYTREIPRVADLLKPACPEGYVPTLTRSAAAIDKSSKTHPILKGNPILRPQGVVIDRQKKGKSVRNGKILEGRTCSAVPSGEFYYYYAEARSEIQADGAGFYTSVHRPDRIDHGSNDHTLNEVAVRGGINGEDYVEAGWRVSPGDYGDSDPHLFVFYWVDREPGCWDNQCGWVQTSHKYFPGQNLASLVGREIYIGFTLVDGKWWAWLDDEWLGYYPGEIWNDNFNKPTQALWYGEVATASSKEPKIEMGNGLLPIQPGAATIRMLCEYHAQSGECSNMGDYELSPQAATNCYDIQHTGPGEFGYGGSGSQGGNGPDREPLK